MIKGFNVTFERWDESAAEAGETDDRGYVIKDVSLGDAIRLGLEYIRPEWCGECETNEWPIRSPNWFTFPKWNGGTAEYYRTGIEEQRALHIPESVTTSSRKRIARLFGLRA